MKIAFSNDHAALEAREAVLKKLRDEGHEVVDYGTSTEGAVDYPDMAAPAVRDLAAGKVDRAVLMCGSGVGMSIAANRFKGVRCVLAVDNYSAEMSRRHNDTNCIALRGRDQDPATNQKILDLWLKTPYEGGRHQRRLDKLDNFEIQNAKDCEK